MNAPEIRMLSRRAVPEGLREIPNPPEQLFVQGILPPDGTIMLAVVGSRRHTAYGKDACEEIIRGLAGHPFAIVSGLALGIDSIAHKAALTAGLPTIAVPGSGLDPRVLYPSAHRALAARIIESGGALLSEFPPELPAAPWTFPKRNRIMAGLSDAVLIVEAKERSGTLITARLALDYNKRVFAVPNSIFSENARGSNRLLRQGATPITSAEDILYEFDMAREDTQNKKAPSDCSPEELTLLALLSEPIPRDALIQESDMDTSTVNQLLTLLEIKGYVKEQGGMIRRL